MKIAILGTGNVAKAFGLALLAAGHSIEGLYGRNKAAANRLSLLLSSNMFSSPAKLPGNCDMYIIAVKDDAIQEVYNSMSEVNGIVVHTSGSTPLLSGGINKNTGVIYPVQTINKQFNGSFLKVPLCIEASNKKSLSLLLSVSSSISGKIYKLNSERRAVLHLAAVFCNNFTNHLLFISGELLKQQKLPQHILDELAISTINNAISKGPYLSQTGPSIRNDNKTIKKHLKLLKADKEYSALYKIFTKQIKDVHNKIVKK
jgi:predicted short-subunit dehydrogenase-like oxidoreductase (DUF2520 family)